MIRLRPIAVDVRMRDVSMRLPFRFGVHTMTAAPLVHLRVDLEAADGRRASGWAAELMVPKWFDKDPAKTPHDDLLALRDSVRAAGLAFRAAGEDTAFGLWRNVYRERVEERQGVPLVSGFGVALTERALIDALCRAENCSFFDGWKRGVYGFDPGAVADPLYLRDDAAGAYVPLPPELVQKVLDGSLRV